MDQQKIDEISNDPSWRVRSAIDRTYFDQLIRIMVVMTAYYGLITIAHFFYLAEDVRAPIMFATTLTTLSCVTVFFLIKTRAIKPSQGHFAFVVPALFGTLSVYLHVYFTNDQWQLTNGILILFGFGVITLLPVVYYSFYVLSTVLFFAMLYLVPGDLGGHFAFMYVAASALSIMCFQLRYRTLFDLERLLVSNRHKTSQMVSLSHDLQAKMVEAKDAAERAEAANTAKDAFLANTTHELKTPLTGVLGMMDILDDMRLTPEQKSAVGAARFSAQTLLVIVNDLLDLAKLDSGQLEIRSVPFSPNLVIRHVCDLLRPAADDKGLTLQFIQPADGPAAVVGDPVRIAQLVLNLVDNAIKFTEEGRIEVSLECALNIEAEQSGVSEADVVLRVKDTGVGIQPQDWMRIFTRFEQLDNSATREADGAGLGLSVCEALVRRMDGQISVESLPGEGTEFIVTLKLPVAEDIENVDLSLVSRPKEISVSRRPDPLMLAQAEFSETNGNGQIKANYKVLLAEDNFVNQLVIKKLAHKFGWDLTVVSDGQKAVDAISGDAQYDVVLMDIRMPVMDGVAANKAIKNLPDGMGKLPIVALTANASDQEAESYLKEGMAAVVPKPINATLLNNTVDRLMKVREIGTS